MYLPFFPLKLVAFPGEALNLHIFELRYRELLTDVEETGSNFGICVFTDKLSGFGTEVMLEKVNKRYEDGRMDIQTRGLRRFKIMNFDNPVIGKLYSGGDVSFLPNDPKITEVKHHEFIFYLKEMLYLLNFEVEFDPLSINSYTFAHKVGLRLEEELELLQLESESDRADFLIQHFKRMIPVIKAVESAKEKIKLNGHFKHLDPLNF
jgi:Lon protease-like protein